MESESLEKNYQQLWKKNDKTAQKNGPHKGIYWVKKREPEEDGKIKGEKWFHSCKYIGEWRENQKEGYGTMLYQNGDKYEGEWRNNQRNGHGTLWKLENKKSEKYKRIYTGDWENDKMSGQGSFFYENDDRYDGYWLNGKKHGQGRMIYSNGDIYEGQWIDDLKEGYGTFTKASGECFEGYWFKDMKHGQGSFYYGNSNRIYVGEWVENIPKCGIFTEVEDDEISQPYKPSYFTDSDETPAMPVLRLSNPNKVLKEAINDIRAQEDEMNS